MEKQLWFTERRHRDVAFLKQTPEGLSTFVG